MKRAVTLKENYEFRRLYQKGASAVGGGMVIYCRKNRLDHNRLGITASVKLGHAVVRNRARRRLRGETMKDHPFCCENFENFFVCSGRALAGNGPAGYNECICRAALLRGPGNLKVLIELF